MLRALTLALALLATPTRATTLSEIDVKEFGAFNKKALVLMGDVIDTGSPSVGSPAELCLEHLFSDLRFMFGEIKVVAVLAELEPGMFSAADDMRVTIKLRSEVRLFLQSLAVHQSFVNQTMGEGECAANGVVAVKSQEILRLYDEAGELVGAIAKKIKAR